MVSKHPKGHSKTVHKKIVDKASHKKAVTHPVHSSSTKSHKGESTHKVHEAPKVHHVVRKTAKKVHEAPKHYSKKFCPQCGNLILDHNTLCENCRSTDFDFKDIKILLCNNCKSYNYKNKWQKFSRFSEVIEKSLEGSIKSKVKFEKINEYTAEELLSFKAGVHKDLTVTVSIKHEEFDLPAAFDVTLCPKCSKQGTKYFEGILQTRNITDDIIKFIKNDAAKQKSKGIHINKEVSIEGENRNIDYYYSDKRYIKVLAERLRKEFGAVIKQNAQLFSVSWETSKNIYRVNMLVDFPKYSKNDVLKIDEQLYMIVSMDEKIHVINLSNNKKTLIPHKSSYEVLKGVEVIIIKKYPEFEVLDPTTYYQARLMNPDEKIEVNQKIRVVIDGGEAWMVKPVHKNS